MSALSSSDGSVPPQDAASAMQVSAQERKAFSMTTSIRGKAVDASDSAAPVSASAERAAIGRLTVGGCARRTASPSEIRDETGRQPGTLRARPREVPMRTFVLAALLSSAALAKSEDRSVPSFSSVHVSAGMRATIEIGPQKPVHIEADESVLGLIETVVEDGVLNIRFKPHTNWTGDHTVRISIQTPQLHAVSGSGGGVVKAARPPAGKGARAGGGRRRHNPAA